MSKPSKRTHFIYSIFGLLLLSFSCLYLGFKPSQNDFHQIFLSFCIAFCGYAIVYKYAKNHLIFVGIGVGVLIRLLLVFALPNLSDDIYRFIWDGRLLHAGISPYAQLPSTLLSEGLNGINEELFNKLNSPNYFSIYPPVTQGVFYISTWTSMPIVGSNLTMKMILLVFEGLGIFYLYKLLLSIFNDKQKAGTLSLLYFLNPLLIIETSGNLHFEGLVIALMTISFCFLHQKKWMISGLFLALSVGVKLIPLILLPYIIIKLKGRARWQFTFSTSIVLLLLFLPILLSLDAANFLSSLDLYFRKFEFNGSVYYILRSIGFYTKGYNLISFIGPSLALVVVLSCACYLWKSIKSNSRFSIPGLAMFGLFALSVYYFTSTTVHPWYTVNLLFLCLFTSFRFPIIWTFIITLTYINYSYIPYNENLYFVFFEYVLVFAFLIWELKRFRNKELDTFMH